MNYKLDGTYGFSGPAPYSSSNETSVLTVLRFGGVSGGTIYDQWGDGSNNFAPYSEYDQGWVSENIACQSTSCFDFQGTIDVQGSNPVVPLDLSLRIDCSDLNCSEDFSHTGTIGISIPQGVTYSSASGVFLTEPAEAPERTMYVPLVAGIGLVLVIRRRHAQQRA